MSAAPATAAIRSWFPALAGETVFLENAGGSQVPHTVPDAIRDYMRTEYVQLGAGYPLSQAADAVIAAAHAFSELLVNGAGTGKAILGPSSSQLVQMLALCYGERLGDGDAVVVMEAGHETNVGPWTHLAQRGVEVRTWRVDPATGASTLEGLDAVLDERVRVVAVVHVSNLLGDILDVATVAARAHAVGARVVVDGVAYAPHRAVDVAAWDADWYVFSTYKVYGPHMAVLWGREDALAELRGPNHYFVPDDDVPYKFELGGVNHEGCAGWLGVAPYLAFLAGGDEGRTLDRAAIERAFDVMTERELPLQERLIEFLRSRSDVRIVGSPHAEPSRVATVSFVHERLRPSEVVAALHARGIAVRHGHMYAHRLCKALGFDTEEGVVRVSAVHYNTVEEIDRLIATLDAGL